MTHDSYAIPDRNPSRIRPRNTVIGVLRRSAAAELVAVEQRRHPARPNSPNRPIPDGRPRLDRRTPSFWTARSRSSGRYLRIPVRPGLIAKEPLHFLLFNPHSQSVQKYFLFSPEFDAQPPELSKYRTHHPSLVISRVRPQNYPLFMF